MILNLRNPVTIISLKNSKFENWKIFEQSRFDVPVSKSWASKSSSGSYRYLTVIRRRQGNDGKERARRYEVQIAFVAEYETLEWQYGKFITGEDLELLVSWQKSRNGTSRRVDFDEADYKKHFTKFVQGDFYSELEVRRISTRKDLQMQATGVVIKSKVHWQFRQTYQRKFWG